MVLPSSRSDREYKKFRDAPDGLPAVGVIQVGPAEYATSTIIQEQLIIDNVDTTTPLSDGASFTSTTKDMLTYKELVYSVYADQNGDFKVQESPDETTWIDVVRESYTAGTILHGTVTPAARYVRIVFTNNSGADQTIFRLWTRLIPV